MQTTQRKEATSQKHFWIGGDLGCGKGGVGTVGPPQDIVSPAVRQRR